LGFAAVLSAGLALALLVGIVPLLRGGDDYELMVKSVLLLVVVGYAWLQWQALRRARGRFLKTALCLNAFVLLPLGITAVLCRVFLGGFMPREAGILGGATAVLAAGIAIVQGILLMRKDETTSPKGG